MRGLLHIVGRQVRQQLGGELERVAVVVGNQMYVAGNRRVGVGGGEHFKGRLLARGGLDDLRAADEEVGVLLRHYDEVHQRGAVRRSARAGAGDNRNLRHDARKVDVLPEDFSVAGEGFNALLNARAARVVDADYGHSVFAGKLHEVADFLGVVGAERPAGDREVLAERRDLPAVDGSDAAHYAVGGEDFLLHAKVVAVVLDVHSELHERARVEQGFNPVAGRHEALLAAGFKFSLSARIVRLFAAPCELFHQFFCYGHFKLRFR